MSRQVLSDLDFNNASKILNLPNGTNAQDPVTVSQLNAVIEGLAWKDDVVVASTANVNTPAPGASIDGVTLTTNDRVLLKAQTVGTENGIYIFNGSAVPMTRSLDMNSSIEFNSAVVPVTQGTSAGTQFRQTAISPTIGTTSIAFTSFAVASPAASQSTAGIAMLASQTQTDVGTDDTTIVTPLKLSTWSGRIKKFAQTIGDNSATSYTVTHNLNSRDVSVECYRNSGNFDSVFVETQRTTLNSVTLVFSSAPALNSFRVLVVS